MNLLLDTHVLLWFLADDPQLVPNAKALIEDPANYKRVSVATCWEISIKVGLKKIDLGEPATTFLPRELATNNFDLLGSSWLMRPSSKRCRRITRTRSTGCWSLRPSSNSYRWSALIPCSICTA